MREAELLGAELNAYHTRENLVLEAKFLRDDLPYFVELLGEVAASTKYQRKQCLSLFFSRPAARKLSVPCSLPAARGPPR